MKISILQKIADLCSKNGTPELKEFIDSTNTLEIKLFDDTIPVKDIISLYKIRLTDSSEEMKIAIENLLNNLSKYKGSDLRGFILKNKKKNLFAYADLDFSMFLGIIIYVPQGKDFIIPIID